MMRDMNKSNTTEQPEIERACGTCARWTQCSDARMADHGECEYRDVGHYSHKRTVCLLTPSGWMKNAKK